MVDASEDTDEQPNKEIYRTRSGRILSAATFVLIELKRTTLPAHRCVHQPEAI